jgi:hypothetical protein
MSNPLKMWISKFRSFHKRNMRKRLKIPKGYLENVHRIRTDNTMTKRIKTIEKTDKQNTAQKTKD